MLLFFGENREVKLKVEFPFLTSRSAEKLFKKGKTINQKNKFMTFFEIVLGVVVIILAIVFLVEIFLPTEEKVENKKEQKKENLKIPRKKEKLLADKIVYQHVKRCREKELRKKENQLKTKEVLQKPSLLHRIIVLAWEKEKSFWNQICLSGKNKGQEVQIECYGVGEDPLPDKVYISLTRIPDFDSRVYKELIEFSDEEKEKIEKWLQFNISD